MPSENDGAEVWATWCSCARYETAVYRIKAGKRQGKKLLQWYLADGGYGPTSHLAVPLEHLAEVFPRHIQIHYGRYRREELCEAARRSRACAYLSDDDHGPLALQEILLAGCPTVGVRTGASFVRNGETGIVVDRLPPGAVCVECDEDAAALDAFIDAIEQAQAINRPTVRAIAAEQFNTASIVEGLLESLSSISQGVRHQHKSKTIPFNK